MTHLSRAIAISAFALTAFAFSFAAAAPAGAAVIETKTGPVNVEPLAKLNHPWGMTFPPTAAADTENPAPADLRRGNSPSRSPASPSALKAGGLLDVGSLPGSARTPRLPRLRRAVRSQTECAREEGDPLFSTVLTRSTPR